MKKLATSILSLTFVCLIASAAMAADPVQLRYQFSEEKPLMYQITTQMEQTQKIGEISNEMKMVNTADTEIKLTGTTDDGAYQVDSTTKRLRVSMESPAGPDYEYDSASPENPTEGFVAAQLTPVFDALNGTTVKLELSQQGNIEKVTGYADLMKSISGKVPGSAAGNVDDEAAKLQYEEVFPTFPATPLKADDKWETDFKMDMGAMGKAEGKKVFTYRGPSEVEGRETVAIEVEHNIEINIKANQGLSTVEGSMKTRNSKGLIHFDPAAGEIVKIENQYMIVGDMKVTAGGQVQLIKSEQNHKIVVDLLPAAGSE